MRPRVSKCSYPDIDTSARRFIPNFSIPNKFMHIQNDFASQKRKIHAAPAQVHDDKKVFNCREREIKEHKSVTKWVAAWLINEGFHHDSRACRWCCLSSNLPSAPKMQSDRFVKLDWAVEGFDELWEHKISIITLWDLSGFSVRNCFVDGC